MAGQVAPTRSAIALEGLSVTHPGLETAIASDGFDLFQHVQVEILFKKTNLAPKTAQHGPLKLRHKEYSPPEKFSPGLGDLGMENKEKIP
jgi:hypothetical protein